MMSRDYLNGDIDETLVLRPSLEEALGHDKISNNSYSALISSIY